MKVNRDMVRIVLSILSVAFFYFLNKKLFFMCLFIFLNYLTLAFKIKYGIDFPIEVISLGTFMCGYIYGPVEGVIISSFSFVTTSLTGRLNSHKFTNNLFLVGIGFSAHYLRSIPLALAGIGFLLLRYLLDTLLNIVVLSNPDYFRKLPRRAINVMFYLFFYFNFGQMLAGAM